MDATISGPWLRDSAIGRPIWAGFGHPCSIVHSVLIFFRPKFDKYATIEVELLDVASWCILSTNIRCHRQSDVLEMNPAGRTMGHQKL